MGAITHNGEVLQRLPADASQINFDKTGTDLNSTQTENAIKEVNTKANNLGYCNVLNAEPITLAGDAELNNITNVGVYGGVLYPSNLGHSPEPSNANASQVKLLVSQTGSSLINSLEQEITIINNVSGANNTYKRQFLNNTWSDWTSYDKDIASLKSGLTSLISNVSMHDIGFGDYDFDDLTAESNVTWFTNWTDSTNFPAIYGSGVLLPGKDPTQKAIIYMVIGDGSARVYTNTYINSAWGTWKQLQFTA